MVVHVQEIELSPPNSSYPGEEWHVQGQTVRPLSLTKYLSQRVAYILDCIALT